MKKTIQIILMLIFMKMNSQVTDTFTTIEYNDEVSTQNNSTKINLFNLEFDGEKIPINLLYNHSGYKVNETPSSLGIGWQIQEIGKIVWNINDENDSKPTGWFNTPDEDYTNEVDNINFYCTTHYGSNKIICPEVNGSFPGNDLSPDFFSVSTSNGIDFDFIYKKSTPPIPVILSNYRDYEINTNFSNFLSDDNHYNNDDSAIVFDVIDTNGNKYDFINGRDNPDLNRTFNGDHRNNFYLSSISNPSKTSEILSILYRSTNVEKRVYYNTGYSECTGIPNSNCDDIHNYETNYFTISENRYDISEIRTKNSIVKFNYHSDYLEGIDVTDLSGNYIMGYYFSYVSNPSEIFLQKIEKYSVDRTHLQTLYKFEYFDNDLSIDYTNEDRLSRDYFGYFNNTFTQNNMLPYAITTATEIIPAADLTPKLTYAKYWSLKSITNKLNGKKEFEYRLKTDICGVCGGDVNYGGGLVIDSIIITPSKSGDSKYIKFDYDDLDGFIINTSFPRNHFAKAMDNDEFIWSSRIELLNVQNRFDNSIEQPIKKAGNFYKKITESTYNYNSMNLVYKIVREYEPNPEGIYFSGILKKESFFNPSDLLIKTNDYFYSNNVSEVIQSASYRCDTRNLVPGYPIVKKVSYKRSTPIYVNKNSIIENKITSYYENTNPIINQTFYEYVTPYSNLVRSITKTSSTGNNNVERYFYPNDQQLANIPNINLLQINNRIGSPLKIESFNGAEKTSETNIELVSDASTSSFLLPKFVYSKKGNDTNSSLEKKLTYNRYDNKGNLVEYNPENGINTCIIWGYNETQPVAKLENINYNDIPQTLIDGIHNADDNSMSSALDNLRNDSAIVALKPMITTMTYRPLIGISSVTDPKGYTSSYEYDDFNRLKYIKDADGNLIKEYEYNYEN